MMPRRVSGAAALAVVAVVGSAALLGCGTTKAPAAAQAVAAVQGSAISAGALAHWIAIKRSELQSSSKPTPTIPTQVREEALAFLITADWLEKEAAGQGVGVSASEVDATYQQLLNAPTGQSFAASLKSRGISSADELRLLRLAALAQKLRTKIALSYHSASTTQARQHISAFIAAYRRQWKQRTTCRQGYIIAECSNGPPLPAAPESGS